MSEWMGRRAFLVGAGAAVALAACSGSSDSSTSTTTSAPGGSDSPGSDGAEDTAAPADVGRVLLLGEEYLLADALALGIVPIASTATVAEAGFIGIPDYDTTDIQVLENDQRDLESLIALNTDRVVAAKYVVDTVGENALAPFGELTVIPDGLTAEESLRFVADAFDRGEQADAVLARLEEVRTQAREEIPDQEVSVAAIYPGPSVAVFADGPWAVPQALLDAGCTLVPGADTEHDAQGRIYLSLENLDLIGADTLFLLVSETVEGEPAALAQITEDPLWTELPAPSAGNVHQLDRLGYPGVEGVIRLTEELIQILGEA